VAGNVEFGSSIVRWRERTLDVVLWAALGIGMAPVVIFSLVVPNALPPGLSLFGLAVYAALVGLTFARRIPHAARCWTALLVVFAFAGVLLLVRGVEGAGRLFLVVLPIHAMVLLGARSGFVATALSVTLYAATAWLHASGLAKPLAFFGGGSPDQRVWVFQGVMLLVVLVPVVLLVSRFIAALQRALAAERAAADDVLEANRERRRLELVLLETTERERKAVGHQLHDGPCQQITAALLRCKVTQNALAARGSPDEVAHLDAIAAMLNASVGEIHDLARGLSPPELSSGALAAALDDLARSVRASGTIACECSHDGSAESEDPAVSGQLFRIAQEAVSNAIRHAKPGKIRIELRSDDHAVRLLVQDDGVGIPAEMSGDGMGIRTMRYRTELMGGSLSVAPAPGGGTLVTCTLPVAPPTASRERGA
jgi:signal transduction histidine kinase